MSIACGEATAIAEGQYGGGAVPIKCRSWGCPGCAECRQRQLQAQLIAGKPERMVTLTKRRVPGASPDDAAVDLKRAWTEYVRLARKRWPKFELHYEAVFEEHKSGWPHLHILTRGMFIPKRWLSAQMRRLCDGKITHVRRIKNAKQAAGYVTKYLAKAPHKFAHSKRYWYTPGWKALDDRPFQRSFPASWSWRRVEEKPSWIRQRWERRGRLVRDLPHGAFAYGVLTDDVRDIWAIADGTYEHWPGS